MARNELEELKACVTELNDASIFNARAIAEKAVGHAVNIVEDFERRLTELENKANG